MAPKIDRREFLIATSAAGVLPITRGSQGSAGQLRVSGLRVDYLDQPIGLEALSPRFSWRIESNARNVRQAAYRILVASDKATLEAGRGDLWDSGEIRSSKSFGIEYRGRTLVSRQRCWWCVQIWRKGSATANASPVSWWEMGLLNVEDWKGQWLAGEDAAIHSKRDVGAHWIWNDSADRKARKFRYRFVLSAAAKRGDFYAIPRLGEVAGIWIDGLPITGPASKGMSLGSIAAGEHLLAIEVLPFQYADLENGLTCLTHLELQDGDSVNLASGTGWKVSSTSDAEWWLPTYDDTAWDVARSRDLDGYQPLPLLPAIYLRRVFDVRKPVRSARLYATALGIYEAHINGQRVGDALLTPEISQYAKRVLYRVYDVTTLVQAGENVLGLTVGDGWYGSYDGAYGWGPPPRRAIAQLELTLVDGSREIVATGPGWRAAQGPIRTSEMRVGELYDARLEQPGWHKAGFDDSHWVDAIVAEAPRCRLVGQTSLPVRVTKIIKAHSITQPKPGLYVFDFGEQFAGWCRLRVTGPRDTRVELKFAELLHPSGEVDQPLYSIGEPKRDVYILKGGTEEVFEPHFTYRGFRYVQVCGLPVAPTNMSLQGVAIRSDLDETGQIYCGVPLIEQVWRNTVQAQRSNFVSIPTDNPSREQHGWMGDAGLFWDAAAFNMDVCAFTSRQMDNVIDDQAEYGAFPMLAPSPQRTASLFGEGTAPIYGDAGIILPWTAWQRYGDVAIIQRHWNAMDRHIKFILDNNPDYLWRNKRIADWGDWMSISQVGLQPDAERSTPKDLIGTAYWAYSADLLAQMSDAIGRHDDAKRLRALFDRIRHAFNKAYVQSNGIVGNGSQTSYILGLKFGLVPEEQRQAIAERLARDIGARNSSLTTGMVGARFVLDVLADAGFSELVYDLLLRTEHPSWGYMVQNGATSIWEAWNGEIEHERKILKTSRNQPTFGAVTGFLFRRVAGIDAAAPGFEKIVVRPIVDKRVARAGADYDSVMGRISTSWAQGPNDSFRLDVTIPPNTSAHVHIPAHLESRISEGRQDISHRRDIRIVERLPHKAVIDVASGTYYFVVS